MLGYSGNRIGCFEKSIISPHIRPNTHLLYSFLSAFINGVSSIILNVCFASYMIFFSLLHFSITLSNTVKLMNMSTPLITITWERRFATTLFYGILANFLLPNRYTMLNGCINFKIMILKFNIIRCGGINFTTL